MTNLQARLLCDLLSHDGDVLTVVIPSLDATGRAALEALRGEAEKRAADPVELGETYHLNREGVCSLVRVASETRITYQPGAAYVGSVTYECYDQRTRERRIAKPEQLHKQEPTEKTRPTARGVGLQCKVCGGTVLP